MPSPIDISNIPAPRVDFIDPRTGLMAREWYRFFFNLFNLTGSGTNDTSLTDLQIGPPPINSVLGEINTGFDQAQLAVMSDQAEAVLGQLGIVYDQAQLASMIAQYEQATLNLQNQFDTLPSRPELGTIASYNLNGSPTAGGIGYGTGSAIAFTPAGTSGQFLTSAAAGTPTWSSPSSVAVTSFSAGTTGLTPATATTGAVTLAGTLAATSGGTGQSSYAVGDLLYASTATALSKLADVVTGNALISGGVGVAPSYGKIGLTTHVSGTLPVANGGTGTATAFTPGSVLFAGASGVYSQDNAQLFWDDTNNELGIGTATPDAQLTVNTIASFGDGATATPSIAHKGDLNTGFWFPAADTIAASTAGIERVRIAPSGHMGVNTIPSPWVASVRAIQLGSGASIACWDGGNGNVTLGANLYDSGGAVIRYINSAAAGAFNIISGSFTWDTAAAGVAGDAITFTRSMTLTAAGNLGIGTTAPAADAPLHIRSVAGGIKRVLLQNIATTAGTQSRYDLATGTANAFSIMSLTENGTGNVTFELSNGSGVNTGMFFSSGTTSAPIVFRQSTTERMRIDSSGYVLAGTSSAITGLVSRFTNAGTDADTFYAAVRYVNSQAAPGVRFGKSRGATVGAHAALVSGDRFGEVQMFGSDGTNFVEGGKIWGEVDGAVSLGVMPGRLTFYTTPAGTGTATEKMRIDNAGNVGIGTATPSNLLSVQGSANFTGNVTLGDATTDTVTVNGYMSVGGTPTASQGLRVIPSALTGTLQFGSVLSLTATSAATVGVEAARVQAGTAAAAFTANYTAGLFVRDASLGAGSTITSNYGIYIDDKTVGTTNYGLVSVVSSGTNKWNIYASGTANNYFAGNVGIGTATNLSTLTVNGSFASKSPSTVNAATYAVAATDGSLRFTTTNCTVTLPAAASFPGRILYLNTITANSVVSASSNVIPLGSNTAGTAILAATLGKFAMLQSDGTNWITMMAN